MTKTITISNPTIVKNQQSANFEKERFDTFLVKKGYNAIHEIALQCPCKSPSVNQQSNCKNCGGIGWLFINPNKTRFVLTSMNMSTKYKEWSQENRGNVLISHLNEDKLSYMDKITVLDSVSQFNEVRFVKKVLATPDDILFFYTSYKIKSVNFIGLFKSVDSKLDRMEENADFTFKDNKVFIDKKFLSIFNNAAENGMSVTIRYTHHPEFIVVDLLRGVMTSKNDASGIEKNIDMPLSAVGRRLHFILDSLNISESNLFDNSFIDDHCLVKTKIVSSVNDTCP